MKSHAFALPAARTAKPSAARNKLIEAVSALLENHHPSELTTSMILKAANVARNTLYLHFEDLSNLLETVLLKMFSQSVEANIRAARQLVENTTSKTDFLTNLSLLIAKTQGPQNRAARFARCRLVAYSESNPRLAKLFAAEQERLNLEFQKVFEILEHRGWLCDRVDPRAAGVLVQALTLGKVIDDVSDQSMPESQWNDMFVSIVMKTLIKSE
jgi:AcrR family transcriptional regulator